MTTDVAPHAERPLSVSTTGIQSNRALVAACSNGVAGVLVFSTLPLVLGGFAQSYGLSDLQTGTLGSIYFGLYSLVALSSVFWIQRSSWRVMSTLGLLLMLAGLVTCLLFRHYTGAIAGLSVSAMGAAIVTPISFSVIAQRQQTERDYAIKLIPEQLVPGILIVVVASLFAEQLSIFPFLLLLCGLMLVCLGLSQWIPARPQALNTCQSTTVKHTPVLLALLALNLYFLGFAGLWAFLERIGDSGQLDTAVVGQLLALGLMTSALGPLCAALLGERWGRTLPLLIALVGCLLSLGLLISDITLVRFGLMVALLPLAYYFGIGYFFAAVADADKGGAYTALMPFSLALGAALGPYLFALCKTFAGLPGALALVAVTLTAGTLLLLSLQKNDLQ
jgi:predicted MFS family arabinose efflux permease